MPYVRNIHIIDLIEQSHDTAGKNIRDTAKTKRVSWSDTQRVEKNNEKEHIDVPRITQSTENKNIKDHHLRTEKSIRPKKDGFRSLTPKELRNTYSLTCKDRIGQHFYDKETKQEFIIDSIVMKDVASGLLSKTVFYRYFDVSELLRPTTTRIYEYTSCAEMTRDKTLVWIPRGKSSIALAIRASSPRDDSRALNQTKHGKPLKYRTALELDRELWTNASEEEWNRLLENTLRPIWSSEIPQGTKVAYYNQQVKEKEVLVDGIRFVEARVRGTIGGDKLEFKGATSANTADYVIFKNIISGTLHDVKYVDPETRFINTDMVDFYLASPMEDFTSLL